ncbi:MAG: ABC transporter [Arachnia propionica]|nr:MAG: ABC transporter [Arachnia propionica]
MKTTVFAYLKQYRRLLSERGNAHLSRLIRLSLSAGVIEALALLSLLVGATTLLAGGQSLGLTSSGWVWVLLVLGALGFVIAYREAYHSYRSAQELMRSCHIVVGDKIASLPLGWFGITKAGEYSRAMTNGMLQMGQALAHMMTVMLSRISVTLVLLVGLWLWQPLLGLVLTLSLPFQAVVMAAVGRVSQWINRKKAPIATDLANRIVEFASCQGALRSAGRSSAAPQLTEAIRAEAKVATWTLFVESGIMLIAGMVSQAIVVALIYFAAQLAIGGELSAMATIVFIGLCLRVTHSISQLSEMTAGLQSQTATLAAISDVLDAETLPEPAATEQVPASTAVELANVTFGYDAETPVLRDVSFATAPNTMTAIVGPSGSGKTTIARLVSRFYDCDQGKVLIGGIDVRDFTTADLMAQLSMVFQDVYLFNDTLEANIRVGRPDASSDEVRQAAATAGVTEIVRRLPDGWDTQVGEGGGRLSGGERQRVSIARALLKQAPIVLVDEATSALDAENEINIQGALEQLRASATVLVIAHKLDTVRNADQIVVLDEDGAIAQVGTHDSLVEQPGSYQNFWRQRETAAGWQLV